MNVLTVCSTANAQLLNESYSNAQAEDIIYSHDLINKMTYISPRFKNVSDSELCHNFNAFKGDRISDPAYSNGNRIKYDLPEYDSNPTFCFSKNIKLSFAEYSSLVLRKLELRFAELGHTRNKLTEAYFAGYFVPTIDDITWAFNGLFTPQIEEAAKLPNASKCMKSYNSSGTRITPKYYQACLHKDRAIRWAFRFGDIRELDDGAYLGYESLSSDQIIRAMYIQYNTFCTGKSYKPFSELTAEVGLHETSLSSDEFLHLLKNSSLTRDHKSCIRGKLSGLSELGPQTIYEFVYIAYNNPDYLHWKNRWTSDYGIKIQRELTDEKKEEYTFPDCPAALDIYQVCK